MLSSATLRFVYTSSGYLCGQGIFVTAIRNAEAPYTVIGSIYIMYHDIETHEMMSCVVSHGWGSITRQVLLFIDEPVIKRHCYGLIWIIGSCKSRPEKLYLLDASSMGLLLSCGFF